MKIEDVPDETSFVNKKYGFANKLVNPHKWGNTYIKTKLLQCEPFIAGKIGGIECSALQEYFNNEFRANWFKKMHWTTLADAMFNNAGIYPQDSELLTRWSEIFSSSLANIDLLAVWNPQYHEDLIIVNWAPDSDLTTMRALEPFYHEDPWSLALESKNILVVSPFTDTIEAQYANKNKVWSNLEGPLLPDFELKTLKCPLSPALVAPEHETWEASLSDMCEKIKNIDFDVALIGAGAYSLPLCNFIKRNNKSAIHMGGGLQILFGIKGNRWLEHEVISQFFNDHWVYPSKKETPENTNLVEGSCYWK